MSPQTGQLEDEELLLQRALRGAPEALAALRDRCHGALTNILLARGASLAETEEVLAALWAACVPGFDERPSLLEKFSGKCSLQSWLATVATNKWIDSKRTMARRGGPAQPYTEESREEQIEGLSVVLSSDKEEALVDLLRESLQAAFALCPPPAMVLLRLVYLHGLTQRELVRMLGWHESKVSRALSSAMEHIQINTLCQVKKRDPWLELTWQDFLDLCETRQIGFL